MLTKPQVSHTTVRRVVQAGCLEQTHKHPYNFMVTLLTIPLAWTQHDLFELFKAEKRSQLIHFCHNNREFIQHFQRHKGFSNPLKKKHVCMAQRYMTNIPIHECKAQ